MMIEGTTCKTYQLPRRDKDNINCIKCGLIFSRKKQLKRHLKNCPNQETSIVQGTDNLTDGGFLCRNTKPTYGRKDHACSVCGKMFKLKIGLKKHTEKAHFKTTNAWNGKEYGTVVQISLAPKAMASEKITKHYGNVIVEDEFEPVNLLHEEINGDTSDKDISFNKELMSINSKVEDLGQHGISDGIISTDSFHEPPVNLLLPKRKPRKLKAYDNYLMKILTNTAPKIFKDKIRKIGCNFKEANDKISSTNVVPIDKHSIPMEGRREKATQGAQDDLDTKELKSNQKLDDMENELICSLQSFSLTPEHRYELKKPNNLDRPSSLDSTKIGRHRNEEELRILHDDFIYRTVMAEILKNEARIIFDKVILSCYF